MGLHVDAQYMMVHADAQYMMMHICRTQREVGSRVQGGVASYYMYTYTLLIYICLVHSYSGLGKIISTFGLQVAV